MTPMTRHTRRIALAAVATVCAIGLVGCSVAASHAQRVSHPMATTTAGTSHLPVPSSSSTAQTLAESAVPTTAPVVVTIGDSIMKGAGLDPAEAWPALLGQAKGWTVTNLGCNGAGFVQIGDADDCNGDFSTLVPKAVALNPSIVIIAGSSNDLGISDTALIAQTNAVVTALHTQLPFATIAGISPVWGDTATPRQMSDINAQVQDAIAQVGGTYLEIGQPLADQRDLLQGDDVHPTADGQQVLAKAIQTAADTAQIAIL
jgi:acyl-CoA thioesterase-1